MSNPDGINQYSHGQAAAAHEKAASAHEKAAADHLKANKPGSSDETRDNSWDSTAGAHHESAQAQKTSSGTNRGPHDSAVAAAARA